MPGLCWPLSSAVAHCLSGFLSACGSCPCALPSCRSSLCIPQVQVWMSLYAHRCPHCPPSPSLFTFVSLLGCVCPERWLLLPFLPLPVVLSASPSPCPSVTSPLPISVKSISASSCQSLPWDPGGLGLRFLFPLCLRPRGAGSLRDELTQPDPDWGQQ